MYRSVPSLMFAAAVALLLGCSIAVALEESAEATREYNAAAALHNVQSWNAAASTWKSFIDKFPQDPRVGRAYHYLGVCLFNQKQYQAAAEAFQQSLTKNLDDSLRQLSLLYRGIALFEAANQGQGELFDAARSAFEEYLRSYREGAHRAEASYYLAECLYFQGQKDQAVQAYRRFLNDFPNDARVPEVLFALAVTQEELGNRQGAAKDYLTFVERYPNHSRANEVLYRIGEVQYALGDYEQADLYFRKAGADSRFSDADLAVIRSGDALVQLKQYEEAGQQYASVEKRFPQSPRIPQARLGAGKCYYLAGRYDAALPHLLRAAQSPDVQGESLHWAARCYLKLGQPQQVPALITDDLINRVPPPWNATLVLDRADALYETPEKRAAAVSEYARAARLAPNEEMKGEALYAAVHTALSVGQPAVARQYAEQFQKEVPNHVLAPEVAHVLAECEFAEERYDRAAQLFERLAQTYAKNPQVPTWRLRQLLSLQLAGKHKEVVALGEKLVDQFSQPDDQAGAATIVGSSQLELNDIRGAQDSFLFALGRSPKGQHADRAMLLLASAYHRQGRTADARTVLERLIREFPKSALLDRAHYRLGEYCFSLGDYPAAEVAYRQVVEKYGSSPLVREATYELACTLLQRKKVAEAEQLIQKLVANSGNDPIAPRARYLLGVLYSQTDRHDEALRAIDEAIKSGLSGADRSAARYTQGLILIDKKQYDQAVEVLQGILAEDPNYRDADKVVYQCAWAHKLAGREAEAIKLFSQLMDKYPDSPFAPEAAYHVAGQLYAEQRYAEAAQRYHQAFQKASSEELKEKAVHRLGWCYFQLGQYQNAAQTFAYQKGAHPRGVLAQDAAFMEAESLFRQAKFAEALKLYEAMPRLETQDYQVLRLLHAGQSAAQTGDVDKALRYFKQLQAEFPNVPEVAQAEFEIGMIHYNRGELALALERFRSVLTRSASAGDETTARAQFMIGEIQMQQKQYDEAVKSFFRVAYGYRLPRWQAAALFEAARCFEMLQRPAQAIQLYRELVEKFPESDRIADAKAKLELLKP